MDDDFETLRAAILADNRPLKELADLAGTHQTTLSLFTRRGVSSLSYVTMKKLVPIVMPAHRAGIYEVKS